MAPHVRKVKTAFLYYQGDQLSVIRKELGLSMGDAMTEVSTVGVCFFLFLQRSMVGSNEHEKEKLTSLVSNIPIIPSTSTSTCFFRL